MRRAVYIFVFFSAVSVCSGAVITVDDNGPADFNNIQEAIDFASYGDTIQVAEGTYIENITLKNGVSLIGQEPNNTIIDGNDYGSVVISEDCDPNTILEGFTITNGNSDFRGGGMLNRVSKPTVINCAFRYNSAKGGGGMYNEGSSPIVTECTFIDNTAVLTGGGMDNRWDSSPKVTNCTFSNNTADNYGGGIYNDSSGIRTVTKSTFSNNTADNGGGICSIRRGNLIVTDCIFIDNTAYNNGGGIYCGESELRATDCVFSGNSAFDGGGMLNSDNNSTVKNCTFIYNSAFSDIGEWCHGGGMYNYSSNLMVTNCAFTGNFAIGERGFGGGMCNDYGNLTVTNCAFIGNSAIGEWCGGGGMNNFKNNLTVTNCTFSGNSADTYGGGMINIDGWPTVKNSILWGNIADNGPQIYNDTSYPIITYSDIEGGWEGEGNIDADPCFTEPGYWDPNGTPEDANDDFWVDGDYHLQSQGGRWDANSQSWVIDSNTSPCIDAGDWMSPVGFEQFPNGGRINMGAYGGTDEASKSYFGAEPCEIIIAGDINGDCIVDLVDFAIMALHWQQEEN